MQKNIHKVSWKKIIIAVLEGETKVFSPYAEDVHLEIHAIVVEEKTRMGSIMICCPVAKKGIWLLRVKVPLACKSEESFDISDINWVSP